MKPRTLSARMTAWIVLPVVALCLATAGPVRAGADDFEFGKRLAEKRYFKLARKVFDGMLADPAGNATSKDLARYGLATLGYEEAQGAAAKSDTPFADVIKMADAATAQVAEFAQKNPQHERAKEARLLVGTIQIWVVQWAQGLVDKPDQLTARKTTAGDVLKAAREAVDRAEKQFESLKGEPGLLGTLANFNWTMCQYWRALVFEPCSAQQTAALTKAAAALDQYATDHDGELIAVFASDFMGLTFAAQAKCATNDEEKIKLTNKALGAFETCIATDYSDRDTLQAIASGYLHYGQTCLETKRIQTTNYLRMGAEMLDKMLATVPNLGQNATGLQAILVLGDLHKELGNTNAAVDAYKDAGKRAALLGEQTIVRTSNAKIKDAIEGGGKGASGVTDITVLTSVANANMAEGKFAEAISAFRAVIMVAPQTPQGFVEHTWTSWEKISQCYEQLKDPLAAAMALEGIYEAWKDGRIPFKKGDESDRNMNRAGNARKKQASYLEEVARKTDSAVFLQLYKRVNDSFIPTFPDHPLAKAGETQAALQRLKDAREARRTNDASWRSKMEGARADFERIAMNPKNEKRDFAWSTTATIDLFLVSGAPDVKKAAQRGLDTTAAALAYWGTPEAKKILTDNPQLVGQRADAVSDVRWLRGEFLKYMADWDGVLKEMDALRKDPAGSKHADDALALCIEAATEKGDMALADGLMAEMLGNAQFAKHSAVDALVRKLAKKYDDEYRDLTARWNKASEQLNGTREDRSKSVKAQLAAAEQASNNKQNSRVELNQQLAVFERDLKAYRKDKANLPNWRPEIADEVEKKKIPDLKKRIDEADKAIPELLAKLDELTKQAKALQDEMNGIVEAQYKPLREAVQRYQKGFDSTDGKNAKDAFDIASRWYFASRNKHGREEDWASARRMFEHYLALDAVKALPESDPTKRLAIVRMGRVYSYFADKEQDPVKRAEIVGKAVVMLESTLAQRPENNELMVGLLEGRYSAYTWVDESARDTPTYRFVLPKTENAAALKDVIQGLGTPTSKIALPVVSGDTGKQALYRKGVNDWKLWLAKTPGSIEAVWRDTRGGGMDAATYATFGTTDPDFRLAIAAAYAESGTDGDLAKGEAILGTLLKGGLAPDETDEKWWSANTITLRLWIGATERWAQQGGAVGAKVSQYRKNAKQLILGRSSLAQVPEEFRPEWKALIERLNKGLRSENAPPLEVNLDKPIATEAPPEDKPATPPAPAPAAPAPADGAAPGGAAPGTPPGGAGPGGAPPPEPAPAPAPAPGAPGGGR